MARMQQRRAPSLPKQRRMQTATGTHLQNQQLQSNQLSLRSSLAHSLGLMLLTDTILNNIHPCVPRIAWIS